MAVEEVAVDPRVVLGEKEARNLRFLEEVRKVDPLELGKEEKVALPVEEEEKEGKKKEANLVEVVAAVPKEAPREEVFMSGDLEEPWMSDLNLLFFS
jgi:hypothetical protein